MGHSRLRGHMQDFQGPPPDPPKKKKNPAAGPRRLPPNAGKGRPKGVPNKLTRTVREIMTAFAERRTPEELDEMWLAAKVEDPGQALRLFVALAEYFVPKLARTEHLGANGGPVVVERRVYTERKETPGEVPSVPQGDGGPRAG